MLLLPCNAAEVAAMESLFDRVAHVHYAPVAVRSPLATSLSPIALYLIFAAAASYLMASALCLAAAIDGSHGSRGFGKAPPGNAPEGCLLAH